MSINCIHRGGCMRAEPCTDYCRANESAAHSSNLQIAQELRDSIQRLRRTSIPLADLIPLLQRAADALSVETAARPCPKCKAPDAAECRCSPDEQWKAVETAAPMWERMFGAWVKYQAGLPSGGDLLWPNPDWPQDVAMVAHALAMLPNVRPSETNGDSLARELLAQCEAYHAALDMMFARMIERTRDDEPHCFYVTESGQPWEACQRGHALIQRARSALATTEPAVKPRTD